MTWLRLLPWAGYPIAITLFFVWLGARDDLAAQVEKCNTDKLAAVVEAERVAREATEAAMADRLAQLAANAERAERAREVAEEQRRLAESRPVEVREIIEVLSDEECLNLDVPTPILDRLRQ